MNTTLRVAKAFGKGLRDGVLPGLKIGLWATGVNMIIEDIRKK